MDVEPHAPDVVAEDVVVVAFAAWLDHAQVGHRQVAWLITVHLVKVLSCLSIIQKGTFFPQRTRGITLFVNIMILQLLGNLWC